jgi:hypothetical protein
VIIYNNRDLSGEYDTFTASGYYDGYDSIGSLPIESFRVRGSDCHVRMCSGDDPRAEGVDCADFTDGDYTRDDLDGTGFDAFDPPCFSMIVDNKFCEAAVYSGAVFMGDRYAFNEGGPYALS